MIATLVQMESGLPTVWIKAGMTESGLMGFKKIAMILLVMGLLGIAFAPASAQQSNQIQKPVSAEPDKGSSHDENGSFAAIEEEMKAKRAIKSAEKEYQDNLDRARDLSTLGAAIVTSFKEKNSLDQEDIKKLDKVEKLAKGIRRAAGGSEDEIEMEKPPADIASAVEMIGNVSLSLKEKVEKTPKHVVSANVIDEANVLLELVRIVRTLPAKV